MRSYCVENNEQFQERSSNLATQSNLNSPYIDSFQNLSTTATFFSSKGGRWGLWQLGAYVIVKSLLGVK